MCGNARFLMRIKLYIHGILAMVPKYDNCERFLL